MVQVRNRGTVVAGDVEPLASQGYRTVDDILARAVIIFKSVPPRAGGGNPGAAAGRNWLW